MTANAPTATAPTGPAPDLTAPWMRGLLIALLIASCWAMLVLAQGLLHPTPGSPTGAGLAHAIGWTWLGTFGHVLLMATLVQWGRRRLPPGPGRGRGWGLLGVVMLAWLGSGVLQLSTIALSPGSNGLQWQWLPATLGPPLVLAALLVALEEFAERHAAAARALHETGLREMALAREMAEAELSLLQAQIEPHFLFNTLANVRRLLRTDRGAAQALLHALLRYLEETLPRLREAGSSTLAREADLARAYLELHQVRMGSRLAWSVQVPPALGGVEVPPLLLLTLVENAIKHGVAPAVAGGRIDVRAHHDGAAGRIDIEVADTGRGMGSGSGHGTGLANLRARLRAQHGTGATLDLRINEPSGVVARVSLPWPAGRAA